MKAGRGPLAATAATVSCCAAFAFPSVASADTRVSLEPTPGYANPVLTITGDSGPNEATLYASRGYSNDGYRSTFRIRGSNLAAGHGCEVVDRGTVHCEMTRDHRGASAIIDGGPGADHIVIGESQLARAILNGGSGDDSLDAGYSSFFELRGGPGDDELKGFGEQHGGPGADRMEGTQGPDDFYGGPGKDEIDGLGGSDLIHADDGRPDGTIDCGESKSNYADHDYAYVDPGDQPVRSCEGIVVVRDNG